MKYLVGSTNAAYSGQELRIVERDGLRPAVMLGPHTVVTFPRYHFKHKHGRVIESSSHYHEGTRRHVCREVDAQLEADLVIADAEVKRCEDALHRARMARVELLEAAIPRLPVARVTTTDRSMVKNDKE